MLKYISKTLLIAIIAGSLVGFQTTALYAGVTATKGEATTDDKGVITAKKTYQFDKVSDSDMLASLAMLAAGFVAGRMLMVYKPGTMDVYVAGAAGAAYIAGEVLSNLKFKGTIDAMTIEVQKRSDAKINEEQIQRLMDLKKSYEEAKSTTKTKKMLQMASAVAFGVAAAMATYMSLTEEAQVAQCRLELTAATAAMSSCISAGAVALAAPPIVAEAASCKVCLPKLQAYNVKYNMYMNARTPPSPSDALDKSLDASETYLNTPANYCLGQTTTQVSAAAKKLVGTCGTSMTTIKKNQTDADKIALGNVNNTLFKNYLNLPSYAQYPFIKSNPSLLERTFDLMFPTAQAGWLPLLGLGVGTAAAMAGMVSVAAVEIDLMMFNPRNRAIAFAALGGVALMSASSSDKMIKELEANIKKIDSILADLNKLALGAKSQNVGAQNIAFKYKSANSGNVIPTMNEAKLNTPCMTSEATSNCKPITSQLANMPGFGNLPESFKDVAGKAVTLGDNLSGTNGISGSALSGAENLASKQSAVNGLLKDRQAALTKVTNGKVLPQKEGDKFLNKMKDSIRKKLRGSGMTATGMMASIGASPIDSSAKPEEAPAAKPTGAVESVNVAGNGEGEAAPKEDASGLNLDFSEAPVEGFAAGGSGTNSAQPEYDVTTNEIGKENGPSLFEVISSRYLKSGYSKLLEEEPTKK